MSQTQRETIIAALPDAYKAFIVLSREIGTFVVIVVAFAFSQWQNYQMMEYVRQDQAKNVEIIIGLKEQVLTMRSEITEMKTTIRAYELRVYGSGNTK